MAENIYTSGAPCAKARGSSLVLHKRGKPALESLEKSAKKNIYVLPKDEGMPHTL